MHQLRIGLLLRSLSVLAPPLPDTEFPLFGRQDTRSRSRRGGSREISRLLLLHVWLDDRLPIRSLEHHRSAASVLVGQQSEVVIEYRSLRQAQPRAS